MRAGLKKSGHFFSHTQEAFIWIAAIVYFAISPLPANEHFTICPLSLAGFEYCPGCGLGRSIILLLHGHIIESFQMHPLALFALGVLIFRIVFIFKNFQKCQRHLTLNEEKA